MALSRLHAVRGIKHSFDVSFLCPHTGHSKENTADVAEVVDEASVLLHVLGGSRIGVRHD